MENSPENVSENISENVSENVVWGAKGAPQRGEAGRDEVRHGEQIFRDLGGFGIVWSAGCRNGNRIFIIIIIVVIVMIVIIVIITMI